MSDEATAAPEWCVSAVAEYLPLPKRIGSSAQEDESYNIACEMVRDERDALLAIIARRAPEPASQALVEALEEGVNALMIASAVFAVWGDKFAPGTTEMFRGHEKAFLKAAALASTRSATETPTPTAPSLRR